MPPPSGPISAMTMLKAGDEVVFGPYNKLGEITDIVAGIAIV